MTISLPPKGSNAKKLNSYFTPLRTTAQDIPNMTVQVSEGGFWTANNEHQEYFGGTSPTISVPISDAKWVLLTVTSSGLLNLVDGVASGTPQLPVPSTYADQLPLAAIFVGDTTTEITENMVFDIRPQWQIPPDSVSQSQLNDFATITYVDNGLNLKADTTGTANADFTLNQGGGSINDSGIYVDRMAGPDVGIRFNELIGGGIWEFTNDGVTYNPIGVSTGTFYTSAQLDGGQLNSIYTPTVNFSGGAGAGLLDSRYFEQAVATTTFAPIAHTHTVGDITGLANPVLTINSIIPTGAGDVVLGLDELNDVVISGTTTGAVVQFDGTVYRNTILPIGDLLDVAISAPAINDSLMYNGSTFLNRPIVTADISDFNVNDFVRTSQPIGPGVAQDIYGVKTFIDGVIINTSLTVTGADTNIETTELRVTDPYIDINFGEAGVGVTAGVSGIRIDRGTLDDALIQWDEGAQQWELGVIGNVQQILTGVHPHLSSDVTDFSARVVTELGANTLTQLGDVVYVSAPITGEYLRFGVADWENRTFTTDITTELNINNLDQMQDVVYLGGLAAGDFLRYTGTQWESHLTVKADISDFIEAAYIHVTGNETKTGDLTINGNFVVGGGVGTLTTINSDNLDILDSIITLNAGEAGGGVDGGTGTAGIEVDRGTDPAGNAFFYWSEIANTWLATDGLALTVTPLSFVGHQHLVTDISDISATALQINQLADITTVVTVQTQIDDKISRTGDIMDGAANLTFAAGGEVVGLPATPSAPGAATSAAYVDAHIMDAVLHISTDQNTFLDALTLTGGTPLTAADVNQLIGVTSNVQTQLDNKINEVPGAVVANFAEFDATGNVVDNGTNISTFSPAGHTHILNDATDVVLVASTTNDSLVFDGTNWVNSVIVNSFNTRTGDVVALTGDYTAALITNTPAGTITGTDVQAALNDLDTNKVDKVIGAVIANFAEFDAVGNIVDNGNNLTTFSTPGHTHVVADITDFTTGVNTYISGTMVLDDVSNVTVAAPALNDLIQWNGVSWNNTSVTAALGSDYVRSSGSVAESITGVKTFNDDTNFSTNVVITGDLTVNGTNTSLNVTNLDVADQNITLNDGYTGLTAGSTGSGINVIRNGVADPTAVILWDDALLSWTAGLDGSEVPIALENVTVAQPLYEHIDGTGVAIYNIGFGVPVPAAGATGIQVFVNGIKQVEGATKSFLVNYTNPAMVVITFNAGSEPVALDDVEVYGFGYIV